MILHGLTPATLARLFSLDRPVGDDWLLFRPTEPFAVEPPEEEADGCRAAE